MAFPYPGIGDTLYRYYNAWIQTPKLKCGTIECDRLYAASVSQNVTNEPSGIVTYNGVFPYNTTFTFTSSEIPSLANNSCNGELILYMNDNTNSYANISLGYIVKVNNTFLSTSTALSQRYGNYNSVTLTTSGNTLIITVNPGAICRWIYRGV